MRISKGDFCHKNIPAFKCKIDVTLPHLFISSASLQQLKMANLRDLKGFALTGTTRGLPGIGR